MCEENIVEDEYHFLCVYVNGMTMFGLITTCCTYLNKRPVHRDAMLDSRRYIVMQEEGLIFKETHNDVKICLEWTIRRRSPSFFYFDISR